MESPGITAIPVGLSSQMVPNSEGPVPASWGQADCHLTLCLCQKHLHCSCLKTHIQVLVGLSPEMAAWGAQRLKQSGSGEAEKS